MNKRHTLQWFLLPIVFIVIGLGWKYPLLGFLVPIAMFAGIIGAFINGRYVCGHLCPRGAFYDRLLSKLSPKKKIPDFLTHAAFRWTLLILLMGFMVFRLLQNPASWQHWGFVFWQMCLITTLIGIILGLFIHQRSWCRFCPIGTLAHAFGQSKHKLLIDDKACVLCKKCEKTCPLALDILKTKDQGEIKNKDCLKCKECISACPKKALRFEKRAK